MTEVFNKFLDELAEELNAKGAKITKLSLKGKNLIIKLQNGRQIPLRNLPLPNETLLYVATRFLNPKKVAALFKKQGISVSKPVNADESLYDSEDEEEHSTRQTTETSPVVSVLSILAILVLVVLILGVVAYLFGRNNVPVIPPVTDSRTRPLYF